MTLDRNCLPTRLTRVMAPTGGVRGDDRGTRRMALTCEANEDQVEVPGVNDQGDRHVPERLASKKTVDGN